MAATLERIEGAQEACHGLGVGGGGVPGADQLECTSQGGGGVSLHLPSGDGVAEYLAGRLQGAVRRLDAPPVLSDA